MRTAVPVDIGCDPRSSRCAVSVVVRGIDPTATIGVQFAVDVFEWRPLWDLSRAAMPTLGEFAIDGRRDSELGHFSDGWGVCASGARLLSMVLIDELETGRVDVMLDGFRQLVATADMIDCQTCGSTGIRSDHIGIKHGFDTALLDDIQAMMLGRTHGWCNNCDGIGKREPAIWRYRCDAETVERWQQFVAASGGFTIT